MRLVRPTDHSSISKLVGELQTQLPTYAEVGSALSGTRPDGYRHDFDSMVIGHGNAVFDRATAGLKTWQAHRLPGVRVLPEGTPIEKGATVIVTLGTPLLAIAAPCRIVDVISEGNRWGFAYGTLPGHPEQGEEAFTVAIGEDGVVSFEITAFSRPADSVVRVIGPFGRRIQRIATREYLRTLRRFTEHNKEV